MVKVDLSYLNQASTHESGSDAVVFDFIGLTFDHRKLMAVTRSDLYPKEVSPLHIAALLSIQWVPPRTTVVLDFI